MSPAGILIFFVLKKDGTFRLYVDYRGLNKVIIKNRYLFFLIGETLDRLYKVKIFNKFDFKNAFNRLRIKKNDK